VNITLALILTLLTLLSGLIVAFNRFYYARRRDHDAPNAVMDTLIDYSQSFFPVLLFVLVIRSFVFEPFRIPSGSMMPTLTQGDYIFVKKYSYGLRLPVVEKKVIETGNPERGDVAVFRLPNDPSVNYIKRVVGLPGDIVSYNRGRLMINGTAVPVAPQAATLNADGGFVFQETLGEREHAIRHRADVFGMQPEPSREREFDVPAGHYFMMGDNRDNSQDSRYIGPIPETHLVGEAVLIWMHMDGLEWPDWGRIGTKIQ